MEKEPTFSESEITRRIKSVPLVYCPISNFLITPENVITITQNIVTGCHGPE